MTATNHALIGAIIGLTIHQPLLAIPLAILSHFVLDSMPHFGWGIPEEILYKTRKFKNYLIVEAIICFLIVVLLAVTRPDYWWLGALCAFFAAAPDLLSINRFVTMRGGNTWVPGRYTAFARNIQWFEKPLGAVVELAWLTAALYVLSLLI